MTTKNRITEGLPFKEQNYIVFKGQKTKWRIVAIFEEANYLVAENDSKPQQIYIDLLIEKIDAGLAEILEGK